MANAITTNYEFVQPEVGAAQDTWGGLINANWASLDTLLKTANDGIAARVQIANIATAVEIAQGATDKIISAPGIYTANAPVASSGSGSFALDLKTGRNFIRTLNANSTMANPTNQVIGQSGLIYIAQDATGGWTLTLGAHWKEVGGAASIDTSPNAVNVYSYFVRAANTVSLIYLGAE